MLHLTSSKSSELYLILIIMHVHVYQMITPNVESEINLKKLRSILYM